MTTLISIAVNLQYVKISERMQNILNLTMFAIKIPKFFGASYARRRMLSIVCLASYAWRRMLGVVCSASYARRRMFCVVC